MIAILWIMDIPKDKQGAFIDYYTKIMRPEWIKFGAVKGELFRTSREKVAGENTFPQEEFIEILYLQEGLTAEAFFEKVKAVPKSWEISRQYEKQFGANNIVKKILQICT